MSLFKTLEFIRKLKEYNPDCKISVAPDERFLIDSNTNYVTEYTKDCTVVQCITKRYKQDYWDYFKRISFMCRRIYVYDFELDGEYTVIKYIGIV